MQPTRSFIWKITLIALFMAMGLFGLAPMKNTFVFDMHYGALLGAGWTANDLTGVVSVATVTAEVTSGYAIPVSGNSGLNVGILAVYQAADGDWYSFKIRASSPTQILSDRPLRSISAGSKVGNGYLNDAHPNINGGAAIADAFLRQVKDPVLGRAREVEKVLRETDAWTGPSFGSVADYNYPGAGTGFRAATVSASGAQSVSGPVTPLMGGDYIAKLPINTGLAAGSVNVVTIAVEEQQADGSFVSVGSKAFEGYSATYLAEIPFSTDGSKQVRLKASVASASSFYLGQIEFDRLVGPTIDIDHGKVVMLTDSWGTPTSPIAQRLIARLTNATVVSKGIGGQTSSQLLARFDTDVTPEHPDTVIEISGTNDYYAGVTPAVFETNLSSIKAKIGAIGAQAVIFTPSVGSIVYTTTSGVPAPQMFPSRLYEAYVRYLDYADPWPSLSAPWRFISCLVKDCEIAPGETKTVFTSPGVVKTTQFLNYLNLDNPALSVRVGFAPDLADAIDLPAGTTRKRWLRRTSPCVAGAIEIAVVNATADEQTFSVSADIAWKGDLS